MDNIILSDFEDEDAFNEFIDKKIQNFEIKREVEKTTIQFEHNSLKDLKEIFDYVLENVNKNSKEFLIKLFRSYFNSYDQILEFSLEDMNFEIENKIDDYDKEIKSRIEFLEEQLKIAINLELFDNLYVYNNFINSTAESPYYFRGAKAIEAEIKLLESRTEDKGLYIPDFIDLEGKRRTIIQDRHIERIKPALDNSPIMSGEFRPVSYKIAYDKVDISSAKIFMIALLIYIVLISLIVFISIEFRKRN